MYKEAETNRRDSKQPNKLDDLDEQQNQIIKLFLKPDAPQMFRLLGAPGSGKTKLIIGLLRMLYLLDPTPLDTNFLFLTFTKVTRIDLVEKILGLEGEEKRKDYIINRMRNFHSFGYSFFLQHQMIEEKQEQKIFDQFVDKFQFPVNFLDQNHQKKKKKKIKKLAWETINKFLAQASTEEEQQAYLKKIKTQHPQVQQVVIKYRDELERLFKEENKVTFSNVIIKATEYIQANRRSYAMNLDELQLIIVDQFQDSNPSQIKLIQSLIKRSKKQVRLLMIGDYDQNIYWWRWAKIYFIQAFIESQQNKQYLYLYKTYRLNRSVMELSQKLLKSDPIYSQFRQQFYDDYQLKPMNKRDYPVVVQQFDSEFSQVRWVVDQIYTLLNSQQYQPNDIVILCREFKMNSFYQKLKFELARQKNERKKEIPYDFQYTMKALGRKEARYLFALLKYFYKIEHLKLRKASKKDIATICQINHVGDQDEVYKKMLSNQQLDKRYLAYRKKVDHFQLQQKIWEQFFINFAKIKKIMLAKQPIKYAILEISQVLMSATWFNKRLQNDWLSSSVEDFIKAVEQYAENIPKEEYLQEPTMSVVKKMIEQLEDPEDSDSQSEEDIDQIQLDGQAIQQRISNQRKRDLAMIRQLKVKAKRNRMQIGSIHHKKGGESPVVFLCALSHKYSQPQDDEQPIDLENLDLTERERKENMERYDKIQKESEQLRLINNAITRTRQRLYITASKRDSLKPYYSTAPPHPVFTTLKTLTNCKEPIRFDYLKDGESLRYILSKLKERRELRNREQAEREEKTKIKLQKMQQQPGN